MTGGGVICLFEGQFPGAGKSENQRRQHYYDFVISLCEVMQTNAESLAVMLVAQVSRLQAWDADSG